MASHKTLAEFTRWWLDTRTFKPPMEGVSKPSSDIAGVVLYREGPYQVQLFIFQPNCQIPPHRHENVDSYEHYLCGDVYFHRDGKELLPREDFYVLPDGSAAPYFNKEKSCMTKVTHKDWHGAEIGSRGGSFLSIQKWLRGTPGLVELNWEGVPLDEHHGGTLGY